jgi:aspartate aminotransferase
VTDASERIGHPIWILSDEPYNRIVFDGRTAPSPAAIYPHTVVTYSYGKQLLAPGMRIGYLSVPPTCPERRELREAVFVQQIGGGYQWPNALLQHALADLEHLTIDLDSLQRRRDRLVPALRDMGYEASMPEGTFYTMARSPIEDDVAFGDILARHQVLVLPGTIVEVPGWFRVSLTASDDMVESAIPRFAAARAEALSGPR